MSKETSEYRHAPADSLPDISQVATARLTPPQPRTKTLAQQIAQHEAEVQRLSELTEVVEQAVTALVIRLHMASEQGQRAALAHNRADLQQFKDELESLLMEHQRAIERIQSQT